MGVLNAITYHVIGGHRVIEGMFEKEGGTKCGIDRADILVYTGGADIHPSLYGEPAHKATHPVTPERDAIEQAIWKSTAKQYHVGICRGAQLLHVLNGGALWQHVNHHGRDHDIRYYKEDGSVENFTVTSTHHQMMKLQGRVNCMVWGFANQTRHREFHDGKQFSMSKEHWLDPEIIHYPKTRSLCFQPHPEHFPAAETKRLFWRCITRMIET